MAAAGKKAVVYSSTPISGTRDSVPHSAGLIDLPFAILTLMLLIMGVITVFSSSFARAYYDLERETGGNAAYYFIRQLIFAVGGVFVMFVCSGLPMAFYRKVSGLVLGLSFVLLALVPVIGVSSGGAQRWISLGFITFQPSEIAKIGVVLAFANMICAFGAKMRTFRWGILPFAAILVGIVGLLLLQPHISASIIILGIGAVMLFLGGARLYWFVGGAFILSAAGVVVVTKFAHASSRITAWLDPFADATGKGWQTIQSLYAIGSGGLLGLGLGQSRQKYLYLPEEHNDFIFSVWCEEMGFIGALLLVLLFALLIIRGYWIAMHCPDRYSLLVCAGLTTLLAMQVLLNMAVCTNLVPCTGISLPFFSYGGTALLIQMAEMGVILCASRRR
ncbi:MAG: putative lipid II flippase FtsW [Candidatus Heteroscillospira sp.]